MEAVPAGVAVLDRELRYLLVSRRWLIDFHLKEPDILGRRHYDVFPEIPERWKEVHRRCLAGAVERCDEDRFPRADGTVDWTRWEVRPWYDEAGEIGGIVIYSEDITQRKRAEDALRASESRFRLLHRLAVGALATRSEAAPLEDVLEAALHVSGAQKGSVQLYDEASHTLRLHVHRGFGPRFVQFFSTVRDDAAAPCGEALRCQRRVLVEDIDASPIFAGQPSLEILRDEHVRAVQSTPIISRQGRLLGVISTLWTEAHRRDEAALQTLDLLARDAAEVIQRAQAERALRDSERRLSLALGVAKLGIYELDVATGVAQWDRRVREIWGIGPDEPITFDAFIASVHPDDREATRAMIARALAPDGASESQAEYRVINRVDGTMRWISSSAFIERSEHGPVRVVGTIEDISERKRADEALKESNLRLADADRKKDEFLAMLGHELRNPLAAIQLGVELIRRRLEAEPELQRAGDMIRRQTRQLVRLVDDLLELSRIASGKMTLKKERTFLLSVVNQAVETSRPLIESKGFSLEVHMPPEQIPIEGDPARLAQALVNLLNNAAKYTPTGGRISLSAAREDGQAVFRVKDTGIGIAPDMLDAIFELFVQSNHSLDRSQGGLGLGLPLVRKIIGLHGGTATAFSEGLGKGSEFVIRIPADGAPLGSEVSPPPRARQPQQHRILVVDDNRDLADSLAGLLAGSGHEVRTAYDGPSGLQAASVFRPALIFLDIGLPELDGREVARRVRRLPGLEHIALVALSGYGEPKDLVASKEAGFDLHLIKPTELGKLDEVIASLLSRHDG